MNDLPPDQHSTTVYIYDYRDRLTEVREYIAPFPTSDELADQGSLQSPPFSFEHDTQKGVFRLTWADGHFEVFRDKPDRLLVVEPDPETGKLKPVVKRGKPTYLYLCRQEHEVR